MGKGKDKHKETANKNKAWTIDYSHLSDDDRRNLSAEIQKLKKKIASTKSKLGDQYHDKISVQKPKELLKACKNIALSYLEKVSPDNANKQTVQQSDLYNLLVEFSKKGLDLNKITSTFPTPLTIENPTRQNPMVLWHIYLLKNYEALILSKEWPVVLEEHHKRREAFTKKHQGLKSALDKLFRYLQPFDDNLYYPYSCLPMDGRDLNREIIIKQKEMGNFIKLYRKFDAMKQSIDSYQSYDNEYYLKKYFEPTTEKASIWNKKIVILVNELLRIGYSKRQAYIKTDKFLHYAYPHIFQSEPSAFGADRVRQRYSYHESKSKK